MKIIRLANLWVAYSFLIGVLLLLTVKSFSPGTAVWMGVVSEARKSIIEPAPQNDETLQPNPKLSPEQVITIQLEALQHNDKPTKDSGIATTFKFASPANRTVTGPLSRFIQLVKNPIYRPMLNHRRAERGQIKISGDKAFQKITLISAEGKRIVYIFILSKQHEEPYKDCWMTDGVERLPAQEQERDERIA